MFKKKSKEEIQNLKKEQEVRVKNILKDLTNPEPKNVNQLMFDQWQII